MKLEIFHTLHEAFGFAWNKFDTAARLAWFPLVLIFIASILFVYLYLSVATGSIVTIFDTPYLEAVQLVPEAVATIVTTNPGAILLIELSRFIFITVMVTSVLVALYRCAARDIAPARSSFNVSFGLRHLVFIGAVLVSGLGVLVVTYLPMMISSLVIEQFILYTEANPVSVVFPNPDSLHTYENQTHSWIFGTLGQILSFGFLILMVYLGLRMAALPALIAVREPGDTYNSFDRTLAITSGWNTLRLAVIMSIITVVAIGLFWIAAYILMPMIFAALFSITSFLQSVDGLRSSGAVEADSGNTIYFISVVIIQLLLIVYAIIVFGLYAGLGGSLFRHGEKLSATH